jgi:imidazolonepropionase-like amidohydrolase
VITLALALAVQTVAARPPNAPQNPSCLRAVVPPGGVAFVNVAVVPMDGERLLLNRTVLVRGCRIEQVGHRDSVRVPDEFVKVVGGDNAFLMPGLVEAHTHLRYTEDLTLYLARGVTTVRNMIGGPQHLAWRRDVRNGAFGPRIITAAGLPYSGADWSEDRVDRYVDSVKRDGFDFLKVQDPTTKRVYDALVRAARRNGLPIDGHIPTEVGLGGVLRTHQRTLEHTEQFIYHWFYDDYDSRRISNLAALLKRSGVAHTPTLEVIHSWVDVVASRETLLGRPETQYVHPETFAFWNTFSRSTSIENRTIAWFQPRILRELAAAGVPLLVGTDAYMIGLVGGWGVVREMEAMHAAGLSNYEVLRAATATPAEVLAYDAGVIAPGRLADMILIDGNPLQDLAAVTNLRGVMTDGTWHPSAELERRLDDIVRRYRSGQMLVRLALHGQTVDAASTQRAMRDAGDSTRLDVGLLTYVASILRQRGQNDDAIRMYTVALSEDSTSAAAYEGMARAHLSASRPAEAKAALERALRFDTRRESARQLLNGLRPQ